MAADPYSICPCGSGKKLKWCCKDAVKDVEKIIQLLGEDQVTGAETAWESAISTYPDNPWLKSIKVDLLLSRGDFPEAHRHANALIEEFPGNIAVSTKRFQLMMTDPDIETPAQSEAFQDLLECADDETYKSVVPFGLMLARVMRNELAALAHIRLALALGDPKVRQPYETLLAAPGASWLKEDYDPKPPPAENPEWTQANELARKGLWRKAEAAYETISEQQPESADIWTNLGLVRAYRGENTASGEAFLKASELSTDTERAADLALISMTLSPLPSKTTVRSEVIEFSIKDSSLLVQNLKSNDYLAPTMQDNAEGPIRHEFIMLDKPFVVDATKLTMDTVPRRIATVQVEDESVLLAMLEYVDDDPRISTFLESAGESVDSKWEINEEMTEQVPVDQMTASAFWAVPQGPDSGKLQEDLRLNHYKKTVLETPTGFLGEKSPRDAVSDDALQIRLRSWLMYYEDGLESEGVSRACELREELGVPPEREIDDPNVDIGALPLCRLRYVNAASLPTEKLLALWDRSLKTGNLAGLNRTTTELLKRPQDKDSFDYALTIRSSIRVFASRNNMRAVHDLIERTREFETTIGVGPQPYWGALEWLFQVQTTSPEVWAPRFEEVMDSIKTDERAVSEVMAVLQAMGLIRLVGDQSNPESMQVDTRMLDGIIARYARPKSGLDLTPMGDSSPDGIWTPGGPDDSGSSDKAKIWTPE